MFKLDQTCSNMFKLDQTGSNWFTLDPTCSNLFKLVQKWLNVVQNRSNGFKTDKMFTLKCLLAMGGP